MQVRQYSVILLTTSFVITVTSQPSSAFRVFHTPQPKDYSAESFFPNGKGITTLDVVNPDTVLFTHPFGLYDSKQYIHEITRGGTDGLLNDLQLYRNENWTFHKGRDLTGSFNVRRLFACGKGGGLILPTVCGTARIGGTSTAGIGATLELDYRPSVNKKSSDPKPGINNLYWIQRVITNYPPGSPGVHQSYIDNRTGQSNATYPYFGSGSRIESDGYFGDRPYRLDNLNRNYYWIAELYLAEADKSNSQKVTIYNGVRWGWLYRYIPTEEDDNPPPICPVKSSSDECPPPPPPPDPCNGGSGGGGCYRASATDYSDYQKLPAFDINDDNEPQYNYLSFLNFDDVSSTENQETSGFDFDDANLTENKELQPLDNHNSKSTVSTPESTSALGLLALAAWGVVKALKIRKDKQS